MRTNKNSISNFIIDTIASSADGLARVEDFLEHPSLYAYSAGLEIPPSSGFAQALRRLKQKSVIKESRVGGRLVYKLQNPRDFTPKVVKNTKWNGKWCLVFFDIPEHNRVVRDLFRRSLKSWGFQQIQRSVWVSKQPVFEQLTAEIKHLKIERWVEVVETSRSTLG